MVLIERSKLSSSKFSTESNMIASLLFHIPVYHNINKSTRFEVNAKTTSNITDIKKISSKLRPDPIYASDR